MLIDRARAALKALGIEEPAHEPASAVITLVDQQFGLSRTRRIVEVLERRLALPGYEEGDCLTLPARIRLTLPARMDAIEAHLTEIEELKAARPTFYYELGNCLRGYYSGQFATDDEAWDALSERFNNGFPSHNGRHVELRKTLRQGLTKGGNAPKDTFREDLRKGLAEIGGELVVVSPVHASTSPSKEEEAAIAKQEAEERA